MNKCFTCNYFKENKEKHRFECISDCLDCENEKFKMIEDPCNKCGFNNQCFYKKKSSQ